MVRNNIVLQRNIKASSNNKAYLSFKKHVTIDNLKEYCTNKSVLIVGNSKEILTGKFGSKIDSYDIVVRINHGYPRKEYIGNMGGKCNIWAHGFKRKDIVQRIYKKIINDIDYHIATSPSKMHLCVNCGKCFIINNMLYKTPYELKYRFEMSTGLNVVFLFVQHIKTFAGISIVGFDFLKTNNSTLSSRNTGFHNSTIEENCIKTILSHCNKYNPFYEKYNYFAKDSERFFKDNKWLFDSGEEI